MAELTLSQAVDLLYKGRCNVPQAIALSGLPRKQLEAALAARVAREPIDRRDWGE